MKRIGGCFLIVASLLVLGSSSAQAARKNPLEGQPAIRHRLELRNLRFEITPFVGFTLLQDFNTSVLGGGKLEYHLTDWLSIGGIFGGGTTMGTGLKDQILQTLPGDTMGSVPSKACADAAMNKIVWTAAGQAEVTPFTGKFALFSKAFFNYDFYFDLGVGFVNLANDLKSMPCGDQFGQNDGTKIGPSGAIGVHMFFNKFIALDLGYRATVIQDNPAGRDADGNLKLDSGDLRWMPKQFVTIGIAFYLPADVEVSK